MASSTTFLNQWTLMEPFNDINKVPMRVPVNQNQIKSLIYMNKTVPVIKTTMNEFQNNLFSVPFELIMGSTLGPSSSSTLDSNLFNLKPEVRNALISKYWMPWLRNLDTLINNFGFAPFYYKTIETTVPIEAMDRDSFNGEEEDSSGSEEKDVDYAAKNPIKNQQLFKQVFFRFPVSPSMEMGQVETFIYEKEQFLVWKWSELMGKELANTFDLQMYFIVEEMPSLNGTINSRLSPLINDWLYVMDLKQKDMQIIDTMANPRYAVEYSPNMGSTSLKKGDQEYIEGMHPNSFFPNVTVGQFTENSGANSAGDHVHNVLSSIQNFHNASTLNTGVSSMGHMNAGLDPQGTIFKTTGGGSNTSQMSESMDKMALFLARNPELAGNVHLVPTKAENAFYLNPYEKMVTINGPTQNLSDKVTQLQEKFNAMVGMILNSPFGVDTAATSAKSNSELIISQTDTTHNRTRHRIKFYCGVVKSVFKLAFRTLFERVHSDMQRLLRFHIQHDLNVEEILGLERALDFSVVFKPANTEMDFAQIVELYRNGVFSEDEAYNVYFSKIGYTDPPLRAPTMFKQQMKILYRQPPEEEGGQQAPAPKKKKKREDSSKEPAKKKQKKD